MNFIKMFSLVLISTYSCAQGFTPFAIHKPYHSIEATQALINGIETDDKALIIPALRALPTIEAIGITVMGDTPLMYAVRRYLKSLTEHEKNAVLEQVLKGQEEERALLKKQQEEQRIFQQQQKEYQRTQLEQRKALHEQDRINTDKQYNNLIRTLLKGSFVGLMLHNNNQRTILGKSFITASFFGAISALGESRGSGWSIPQKVHHHLISALIGFGLTVFVETMTQNDLPQVTELVAEKQDSPISNNNDSPASSTTVVEKPAIKTTPEHQQEIIQLLLQASQDVTIRNNEGINVVDLVVAYKQSVLQNSPEVDSLLTYIMSKYPKHALLEHPLDDIMEQFMNHTRR